MQLGWNKGGADSENILMEIPLEVIGSELSKQIEIFIRFYGKSAKCKIISKRPWKSMTQKVKKGKIKLAGNSVSIG